MEFDAALVARAASEGRSVVAAALAAALTGDSAAMAAVATEVEVAELAADIKVPAAVLWLFKVVSTTIPGSGY